MRTALPFLLALPLAALVATSCAAAQDCTPANDGSLLDTVGASEWVPIGVCLWSSHPDPVVVGLGQRTEVGIVASVGAQLSAEIESDWCELGPSPVGDEGASMRATFRCSCLPPQGEPFGTLVIYDGGAEVGALTLVSPDDLSP